MPLLLKVIDVLTLLQLAAAAGADEPKSSGSAPHGADVWTKQQGLKGMRQPEGEGQGRRTEGEAAAAAGEAAGEAGMQWAG